MSYRKFIPALVALIALTGCTKQLEQKDSELSRRLDDVASTSAAQQSEIGRIVDQQDKIGFEMRLADERLQQAKSSIAEQNQRMAALELQNQHLAGDLEGAQKQIARLEGQISVLQNSAVVAAASAAAAPRMGEVAGSVSYYFNENFGNRPDVGAHIYLFKIDATAKPRSDWKEMQEYARLKMQSAIGSSQASDAYRRMGNDTNFVRRILAFEASSNTEKLDADGSGAFRTRLPVGHYGAIVVSAHREALVVAEAIGQLDFEEFDVEADGQANLAINFSIL